MGLERDVEVDLGTGGRVTQTLPVGVGRNDVPHVLDTDVVSRLWEGRREVGEGARGRRGRRRKKPATAVARITGDRSS